MNNATVICGQHLVKSFRKVRALDEANLVVAAGQIHGFLGPNGAGKSTTLRAALGQISLTAGDLSVFGLHPRKDAIEIHRRLAYVPGEVSLWPGLTGGECLDLLGRFHGKENRHRRNHLVTEFDLDISKKIRSYSKGNKQKVALIAALALDVDLYVFDEPTSGLDPLMETVFRRIVSELAERGATVLLSSHILDEVESLCSHVTILRNGRTISSGSLDELRQNTKTSISATLAQADIAQQLLARFGTKFGKIKGSHLELRVESSQVSEIVGQITAAHPLSLTVRPPSLDELFLEHYGTAEAS